MWKRGQSGAREDTGKLGGPGKEPSAWRGECMAHEAARAAASPLDVGRHCHQGKGERHSWGLRRAEGYAHQGMVHMLPLMPEGT